MMLINIIKRARQLIADKKEVTAATGDLDFFLQNFTVHDSIEKHLDTFCRLDDHDMMMIIAKIL